MKFFKIIFNHFHNFSKIKIFLLQNILYNMAGKTMFALRPQTMEERM